MDVTGAKEEIVTPVLEFTIRIIYLAYIYWTLSVPGSVLGLRRTEVRMVTVIYCLLTARDCAQHSNI